MKQLIKILHGYKLFLEVQFNEENGLFRVNFTKQIDSKNGIQESSFDCFLTPEEFKHMTEMFDAVV